MAAELFRSLGILGKRLFCELDALDSAELERVRVTCMRRRFAAYVNIVLVHDDHQRDADGFLARIFG